MMHKLSVLFRHLWRDVDDTRQVIPPDMLTRLTQRVAASEQRHTGEIRVCVEASLPTSYLWRLGAQMPLKSLVRQRALAMFGKLGVWDTAHNNGVLVYLLLAEHAIEIVADRGLAVRCSSDQFQAMVSRMAGAFKNQRYEDGLTQALEEISALLVAHFPAAPGLPNQNELPDTPVLQ